MQETPGASRCPQKLLPKTKHVQHESQGKRFCTAGNFLDRTEAKKSLTEKYFPTAEHPLAEMWREQKRKITAKEIVTSRSTASAKRIKVSSINKHS